MADTWLYKRVGYTGLFSPSSVRHWPYLFDCFSYLALLYILTFKWLNSDTNTFNWERPSNNNPPGNPQQDANEKNAFIFAILKDLCYSIFMTPAVIYF